MFERLIRKFSVDEIEALIPESDKKLITNIKKRRENLKRRKAAGKVSSVDSTDKMKKSFEAVIQDSDSELDSEDDDQYIPEDLRDSGKNMVNVKLCRKCPNHRQSLGRTKS
jgi:ribosomal RNA-processing protein 12